MEQDKRIAFAVAQLKGRLHTAAGDKRCGCGQCGHWVAQAAHSAGISRLTLGANMPLAAKLQPHRRRTRRPMVSRICENSTIRARGSDEPAAGIALLLSRLHDDY
ncbi:hypothetical protein C6A86_023660 [Mycobacterium sp. ITM-2016-00316]|uniref:hypothetical protein n=1 Tax=Mycobacterium sp. ITM-2016-00316 TaxID=2099695 RepID=UPI00115BEAD7|nr:hypothetical protein [Mycobacterium sp. ITM-2016-00316]WNG81157.1 hypothetical protein C6A86_023660 [Mycobacterium sp. ITM-2016-00316]